MIDEVLLFPFTNVNTDNNVKLSQAGAQEKKMWKVQRQQMAQTWYFIGKLRFWWFKNDQRASYFLILEADFAAFRQQEILTSLVPPVM